MVHTSAIFALTFALLAAAFASSSAAAASATAFASAAALSSAILFAAASLSFCARCSLSICSAFFRSSSVRLVRSDSTSGPDSTFSTAGFGFLKVHIRPSGFCPGFTRCLASGRSCMAASASANCATPAKRARVRACQQIGGPMARQKQAPRHGLSCRLCSRRIARRSP